MATKQYNGWILFLYLLIAFLFGVSVAVNFLPSKKASYAHRQLNKLDEVMHYIDAYYVDSVDMDSVYNIAISSVLQSLDPHSAYSSFEDNKTMMESLNGAFEGVGIQFNIMNDTVMVIATISGGPSEKAGGEVVIRKKATIDQLKKSRILAGRDNKYHELYDCNVRLQTATKFYGNGYYDYDAGE